MKVRLREDNSFIAACKARGEMRLDYGDPGVWDSTPEAEPGDVWVVHWYGGKVVAGYAICCPRCGDVHSWTTSNNCTVGVGANREYPNSCAHSLSSSPQFGSCWQWTGSVADGTLTASPSLHASGACGWHGWLVDGDLHG